MNANIPHIAEEQWGRLLRGELDPRDEVDVLRHIGECSDCAARVPLSASRTRSLVETWLDADDAEERARTARRRTWMRNALAAAAVVVIAVGIGTTIGRDTPEPEAPPQIVTAAPPPRAVVPPPPAPPASRYHDAAWQTLVDDASRTGTLRFPASLAALRPHEDALRGSNDGAADALSPAGVVVDDDRPRFTWPRVDGATYVVSVFEGDLPVAQSESLETNEWRPEQRLTRGKTYTWQVEVVRDGGEKDVFPAPPAPPAVFRITSRADHEELALAREKHPGDHLLHAVLAARAGLREEALAAWRRAGHGAPMVTNDAQ